MSGRCAGHESLAEELREYAGSALDLLEPWVERMRQAPEATPGTPGASDATPPSCVACPICALLSGLRGRRHELAVRLTDQTAGLLAVLRTALEEGMGPDQSTRPPAPPHHPAPPHDQAPPGRAAGEPAPPHDQVQRAAPAPRVQRIAVDRGGPVGAPAGRPAAPGTDRC